MKKIMEAIIALVVMMAGLAFMAPAASAGDVTYGDEITNESSSSSTDSGEVTSKAKAAGKITAKTVFYVKANGTPKAQQTNCVTTKKAASYWTSYLDSSGKEVWHWKFYPKGKKFCKIGGVMRDPICHNKVKIKSPKAKKPKGRIIRGKIVIKKSMTFVAKAKATTTATGKSTAKAWCEGNGTSAEAYATATAFASAFARATATATTRGGAEVKAKAAAGRIAASAAFKAQVEAEASAKASASATTEAKAKVTCNGNPTPPPPPVTPAPVFMQFREFNDLYKSLPGTPTTMDHCVTVDFPEGHSGEVFWTAELGSFTTPHKAAQDGKQVCSTYTAPSEAGHDTITVTATDSVSSKSVTKTSRAFVIKEWPAIP